MAEQKNQSLINAFEQYYPNNVHWGTIPTDTMDRVAGGGLTDSKEELVEALVNAFSTEVRIPVGKTPVVYIRNSDDYYIVEMGVNSSQ